jgi:hypothetical protein
MSDDGIPVFQPIEPDVVPCLFQTRIVGFKYTPPQKQERKGRRG